jgi:RNA polymerase sigma-70 factor (ECF subfamily)
MAPESRAIQPEQLLEHIEWMRRLARALVRHDAEADDLAQEAVRVALDDPPLADRPVRPWLAGVMRNLARFRARGSARRERRESAVAAPDADPAPSPAELVERVQTQHMLAEHVLRLDEPFRSTVLLRYYEGYSAAEIARKLDIPAGTVRWRLKRALDDLRGNLDDSHRDRAQWSLALAPLVDALPSAAAGGSAGAVTTGALAMKTAAKIAIALALLAAMLVGTRLAGLWGGGDSDAAATGPAKPAPRKTAAGDGASAPLGFRVSADPNGVAVSAVADIDPEGWVRMEGQVIDDDEAPVVGATVAIDSIPPRRTTTEADGSFAFVDLVPRGYVIEARAGDRYAGPLDVRLTDDSGPVILRARTGGEVRVVVVSDADGAPIAGAAVDLRSTLAWNATTGADGTAVLRGVGPGWRVLHVSAGEFAPVSQMITNADSAPSQRVVIRLSRGAVVKGRVIAESGTPVAGARVWASSTSEPFPVIDPRIDSVTTGDDGGFRIGAIGAGTFRFTASHADHAQTTTAPIVLDGQRPRNDVEIRVQPGGTLVGTVETTAGEPVAGAEVRIAGHGGGVAWRLLRTAHSDKSGAFRITGLPRRSLDVVAVDDLGTSSIHNVDLAGAPDHTLKLTLDVTGAIAGIVVDDGGDPVADAQVLAEPRWTGALGEREPWQVRGTPYVVSGAGGRFRFGGLPDGEYVVRAARPGAAPDSLWLHEGVALRPGAEDARIVLPAETIVTGRVELDDGSVPAAFAISLGRGPTAPFATDDGSFSLAAPAGRYNVFVSGPAFMTKILPDVPVKADKAADLGTITVQRGRSVTGRVIDAGGVPVPGARVAAGRLITGSGTELNIPSEGFGVQETTTDDGGRFLLAGFDARPIVVVAGHPERGRSRSIHIPRGGGSIEVDLVLGSVGSLAGTATRNRAPLGDTVIIASPRGATRSNFFTVTGPDGSYALDQVAPGEYVVQLMIGQGGPRPKDLHVRVVDVPPGDRARLDFAIADGPIELSVRALTEEGDGVPMAQVLLASGKVDPAMLDGATSEAMRDLFPQADEAVLYMRAAIAGAAASFEHVQPGDYMACVVALPVSPLDPSQIQRAMERSDTLPLKCRAVELKLSPAEPIDIRVPAAWTVPEE